MANRVKSQTEGWLDIIAERINCPWNYPECEYWKDGYCQAKKQDRCPECEEDFS